MSVTTSSRLNMDQLRAALPAGSVVLSDNDGLLTSPTVKTLTAFGATDAQLQTAITTAAASYVDYAVNAATISANLRTAQTQIQAFIAANPGGATLTGPQTIVLAKMLNGLCKLLLAQFGSTTGT